MDPLIISHAETDNIIIGHLIPSKFFHPPKGKRNNYLRSTEREWYGTSFSIHQTVRISQGRRRQYRYMLWLFLIAYHSPGVQGTFTRERTTTVRILVLFRLFSDVRG